MSNSITLKSGSCFTDGIVSEDNQKAKKLEEEKKIEEPKTGNAKKG